MNSKELFCNHTHLSHDRECDSCQTRISSKNCSKTHAARALHVSDLNPVAGHLSVLLAKVPAQDCKW